MNADMIAMTEDTGEEMMIEPTVLLAVGEALLDTGTGVLRGRVVLSVELKLSSGIESVKSCNIPALGMLMDTSNDA